jgi:hypothetical protein
MGFNTKYIFKGDSKNEIVEKINYNFNQIISFAAGPNGTSGPRGATGTRGPAGKKGSTGSTGERAINWFKQSTTPTGSINEFDLWINTSSGNGQVNAYGATGSWNFTGFSIFDSKYFSTYSWILGPGGLKDKYVIRLSDTSNAESQTLVISDRILSSTTSNPNKSKVVISTADQTDQPILSFGKSGSISNSVPSFYWESSGQNTDLSFRSDGDFDINSLLTFGIDVSLASILLRGNSFNSNSSTFKLIGNGDFDFFSNVTLGAGGNFLVSSTNLTVTGQYFNYSQPLRISGSDPGSYVINDVPVIAQNSAGVYLEVSSRSSYSFRFDDFTGNPIFSGNPGGTAGTGNFAQTVFGSTGGISGGTGGPYFYHVQKTGSVSLPPITLSAFTYPSDVVGTIYNNVVDISNPTIWDRNVILVTPTAIPNSGGVYLRVPSTFQNNLFPVFTNGRSNKFRVLLNTNEVNPNTTSILGLIFTVADFGQNQNQSVNKINAITFSGSGCKFIDLQWIGISNLLNSNPRLFYKTCTGSGGFVNLTNYYSVGASVIPVVTNPGTSGTSTTSGGGGGGTFTGGGGGGGGCFVAGTRIPMSDGSYKEIQDICVGDSVFSFDFNRMLLVEDLVSSVFNYTKNWISEIVFDNGIVSNNTTDHPYWVIGKGWSSVDPTLTAENYSMEVHKLESGDSVMSLSGDLTTISQITESECPDINTYNFHVSKNRNYFANDILVHNKISPIYKDDYSDVTQVFV